MNAAKVTIGIPTYNRAKYLEEAIRSALQQTYANLEIIVSDNGSTDETSVVLSRYEDQRIVVVKHTENRGMVSNWNACLNHATGKFFLLLSDDDILEPAAIETLIAEFSSDADFISYGQVRNISDSGSFIHTEILQAPPIESGDNFISRVLDGKTAAYPSATLLRTSSVRAVGGYPDIGAATDFGLLLLLLSKRAQVTFAPLQVARYRVHGEAESLSRRAISSQLNLVTWAHEVSYLSDRHRAKIISYCTDMVYRYGRYHALRGNRDEYQYALSVLQQINLGSPLSIILRFFDLPIVQRIADLRRAIKSFLLK